MRCSERTRYDLSGARKYFAQTDYFFFDILMTITAGLNMIKRQITLFFSSAL